MIRVEQISKTFAETKAVDDLSFRANDGEILALLGPNGAGKSTTMRMISGLLAPDHGSVQIGDFDVRADRKQATMQLGLLPDGAGLYPRLTAKENIVYFAQLCGYSDKEAKSRADAMIADMELASLANRQTDGFSQGERMKVALARALVHDPQNLVLDEPTNGLDVMSTRAMRKRLMKLKEQGRCLIVSSHIMQEIAAISDRIIVIAHGKLVAEGSLESLCEQAKSQDLEEAFVRLCGLEEQRSA